MTAPAPRFRGGWILSPVGDLAVFAGPVAAAGLLALLAARAGTLHDELPAWAFVLLVVGCDVAHVWSTLFRTYLDPEERARRGALLAIVPASCFAGGAVLYMFGADAFWRVLAYVAVFHFVRQQYGWMAFTARKAGETSALDRRLDAAAIYAATLFPILWWHTRIPRSFDWFREGDFVPGLPEALGDAAGALHFAILGAWVARQAWLLGTGRPVNPAKALVLASTWLSWYGGIVWLDSDLAFTASNVLSHGIPYMALVHRWGSARWSGARGRIALLFRPAGFLAFYALLFAIAFAEEGLWDGFIWHQHAGVFPLPRIDAGDGALAFLVPLLAVPQATHYVLDAFLWRTSEKENPGLKERLGIGSPAA